jgi:hypothetical protein
MTTYYINFIIFQMNKMNFVMCQIKIIFERLRKSYLGKKIKIIKFSYETNRVTQVFWNNNELFIVDF